MRKVSDRKTVCSRGPCSDSYWCVCQGAWWHHLNRHTAAKVIFFNINQTRSLLSFKSLPLLLKAPSPNYCFLPVRSGHWWCLLFPLPSFSCPYLDWVLPGGQQTFHPMGQTWPLFCMKYGFYIFKWLTTNQKKSRGSWHMTTWNSNLSIRKKCYFGT